jgi:S-adenosylmethionine decarboxylase proenzyme
MNHITLGRPVGVHVLINVYDVPDLASLEFMNHGTTYLDQIVHALQLTVVAQTGHQFQPKGYSYAYVLSESHFTIHTYPEYRSCYIDIFCCHSGFNPVQAVQEVKKQFQTTNVRYQILPR